MKTKQIGLSDIFQSQFIFVRLCENCNDKSGRVAKNTFVVAKFDPFLVSQYQTCLQHCDCKILIVAYY